MKGVVFFTEEDARYGFSLAGSLQQTISAAETGEALRRAMADPDIEVLIIDERLLRSFPEKTFAELQQQWRGLLITLPAPLREEGREVDSLHRLIKRALGYHVRLQI